MGCCASKSSSVRSPKDDLGSAQQNASLGKKGQDKRAASVEDFHLAPVQNFESHARGQKPEPGSTNTLDELCGRKEKKSEKGERSSKLNKLFGKKNKEVLHNIDISKSNKNVVNGEDTGVEEEDVGIEICPIDHLPDNDNLDIDIYPLNQDRDSTSNNVGEPSHFVNGMDCTEEVSLNPGIHKLEGDVSGNKKVHRGENAVIATVHFKNHVDPEMTSSEDVLYQHVLQGNMEVAIPKLTKMVRIYASSASTDTQVERNALISRVYPKLKEFCHELGYEFHVVDIHWGIQDAFLDDHMSSEISKIELTTCQDLSTGPSFVTFLSQKYGYCLFPPKIASSEFDLLWSAMENQEDQTLLRRWFKLDNNAIPPEYVLQPISSQFPNVVNPSDKEARNQALNEWWDVFLTLWNALSNVAVKVLEKEQVHKYFMSGVEQEIRGGILNTTHPHSQAFWFHRRITDLKENITSDLSPRYIDIVKTPRKQSSGNRTSKTTDTSAEKLLNTLKEEQLYKTLDKNNVVSYNIKWTEKGVDPNLCFEHAQYIDKFCQDVSRMMKEGISRAAKKHSTELYGPLFEEVAQHTLFCQQFCCNFHGRDETLDEIKNYISGSSNTPFIIHGRSGCGKTSLVAMAAKLTRPWIGMEAAVVATSFPGSPPLPATRSEERSVAGRGGDPGNEVAVVVRFLGKTRHSSSIHLSLRSICLQLTRVYGIHSSSVPVDSHDLMTEFQSLLQNASASRPLVLFLDSLDQLRSCSIVQELSWLPRKLPPHVKLVITCSSEDQAVSSLRNIFSDESHYLKVPDLTDACASDLLELWLTDKNRKLTESQQHFVLQQFTKCRTPLYLKLAFSRALQWKSYSPTDEAGYGRSVRHAINSLFMVLEVRHGKALVHRAFSYITASRRGLSDSELEDVMSCDEVVLDEVFRFWTPPIRRAPPSLWPRIKCDFDSFIDTHVENGVRLNSWSHREFHNVVMERYLFSDDAELHRIHSNLADFFLGRWSQGSKKADARGNLTDRHLSSQPLLFNTNLFNFRKLNELPYHLTRAEDFDRLKQSALCNFEFLSAKLRATSIGDVIDDFIEALAVKPDDPDVKLVFETLLLSTDALKVSADQLSSQFIGRLSSPRSPSAFIARLLRQAHHPSVPALIPNTPCLARPGGNLVHSFPMLPGPLSLNHDGSQAISGSHSQLITLWDVRCGKTVKSLDTSKTIGFLEFCLDDQLVAASCQGSVQLWNLAKEQMEWEIASTEVPAPITVVGNRDTLVAIMGSVIKFVKVSTGTVTREFEDKTFIHDRVAGQGGAIALANSGCAYVRIYDMETQNISLSIQAYSQDSRDVVSDILLTPFNGGQLIVSSQKSFGLLVFDLTSGKCLHVLGPDIYYPTVTKDGRYMLCTNKDNNTSVWNLETAVKEKSVLKHPPTATITKIMSLDLRIVVTVADDLMARVWDLQQQDASHTNFEDNKDENSIQQLVLIKSSVQKQVITKSRTHGPICVWSLSSCQVIRTLNNTNADEILVVDDTRAVIRSGTKLALIDLQQGKLIKHMRSEFPAKTYKVHRHASSLYKRRDLALRLAESPKVTAMSKPLKFSDCAVVGTTHVLVLSKDRLYLKVASLETGELVAKLKGGQKAMIETVMVSGNGLVAVCSCENAPLIVWDLRERNKRCTLEVSDHYPRLTCADIGYNGHYLVDVMKLDKTHKSVVTWDLESGNVKHIIGQGINVWSVALSTVSMRTVVAGRIGNSESLRVYNLVTGDFLHQLDRHTEPVKGVCLSKDGRRALTYVPLSGCDRTVCLWDLVAGTLVSCFTPDLPVSSCILTDDGDQVVMVINKSRPIVSLALSHELGSRELSVDLSNPYFSHPTLHGAVFDMGEELKWNDDGDESDTEV